MQQFHYYLCRREAAEWMINMRTIGIFLSVVLALILLMLLIALVRTLAVKKRVSNYTPDPDPARALKYAEMLSEMVKFETVSYPGVDRSERFSEFHTVLAKLFPLVFEKLEITSLDGNLLIYWKGKSSERPVILMGHQDVVPADGEWTHGYFSGDIEDGKVWGRGACDTKCSVMCILQTFEELLEVGYQPENDLYMSSSCTEEVGGEGAPKIIAELKRRGVRPYLVCDEGGAIITDPIGGIQGNFAMIGVLEKGQGNVRFTARSGGGHASSPGRNTPIVRLAAFENEIEKHDPFRKMFCREAEAMFAGLAPYASFPLRYVLGNLWLFRGILAKVMPRISAEAAAMLKTTMAFTVQSGGEAYNVIPPIASVCANMRFIPHQDKEESVKLVSKIAAKYSLETELIEGYGSCTPVDITGDAFKTVVKAIEEVFPGLPYTPYVMTGGTDARFFNETCDNCIRFSPLIYGPEQMKGMHGLNENIEYSSLPGAVDFYKTLIRLNDAK